MQEHQEYPIKSIPRTWKYMYCGTLFHFTIMDVKLYYVNACLAHKISTIVTLYLFIRSLDTSDELSISIRNVLTQNIAGLLTFQPHPKVMYSWEGGLHSAHLPRGTVCFQPIGAFMTTSDSSRLLRHQCLSHSNLATILVLFTLSRTLLRAKIFHQTAEQMTWPY